jgi:hypothetical protein
MLTSNRSLTKSPIPSDPRETDLITTTPPYALPASIQSLKAFEHYAAEHALCLWSAPIFPSVIERSIFIVIALSSSVAWSQCPISLGYKLLGVGFSLAIVLMVWRTTNHVTALKWHADDTWEFLKRGQSTWGQTASGSYRSAYLIVLAIRPQTGRRTFVSIWRDSVDPAQFSALHIRLLLTSTKHLK